MQTKMYVNVEAGVVVCKVYEVLDKWTDGRGEEHIDTKYFTSAKVTCKDGDVFDEKKGRKLAYSRAMIKAAEKYIRQAEQDKKRYLKWLAACENDIKHNKEVIEYYQEKYDELAK